MNSKGTVLVTGASGFIGSVVANFLKKDGWQVVITTRNVKNVIPGSTIFLDLSDPESIVNLFKIAPFDAIIHLAANVELSGQSGSKLFMPNILSTGLLAELSAKFGTKIIFASSVIVHGVNAESVVAGTSLLPDTEYGKSKELAEKLIVASGARNCILRIGGVFGLNGPSHLGINRSITNAINKVSPKLVGDGTALRNYIYVKDIAATILHILNEDIEGTHLLAGSEVISIRDMLQHICDVFISGHSVIATKGDKAGDQVITSSDAFPKTRSFKDSLVDISKVAIR